jgi:hypothetical protein
MAKNKQTPDRAAGLAPVDKTKKTTAKKYKVGQAWQRGESIKLVLYKPRK